MKAKKILLILISLLIVGILALLFIKPQKLAKQVPVQKEKFHWGVAVRPYALNRFEQTQWEEQLDLVRELGANWIITGWHQWDPPEFNDKIVETALKKKLNIVFGMEPKDLLAVKEPRASGYQMAKMIASRYKGKIQYYSILNEPASTALIDGTRSGTSFADYNPKKYALIRDWLAGAAQAIGEIDPGAKRIISDQWVHTAFFDKIIFEEKIPFEILGWHWYSDMGTSLSNKIVDNKGTTLLDKLKSYGKELWLTEVNFRGGTEHAGEIAQAEFIRKMADYIQSTAAFKGFFVFELLDLVWGGSGKPEYNGLVSFRVDPKDPERYLIGRKKKSFEVYKTIISAASKNDFE